MVEDLFEQATAAGEQSPIERVQFQELKPPTAASETQWIRDLALNKSHADLRVHFLQHLEYDTSTGGVSKRFSWVTDIDMDRSKLRLYQRGGRARWRIENETFNTLKNQGYHYEHNYGHGQKNLSTVLMLLMFLAFLVDQVQQACCPLFQAVLKRLKTRRKLWDHRHVRHFRFRSFVELWTVVLTGSGKNCAVPSRYG